MDIGNHIHKLLLDNERVIIPGFGAFSTVEKPAEIIDDNIYPPSKEILFSTEIRNNDGLLVGSVADDEDISHFDALKTIEKERDSIVAKISEGERVSLEKIGTLYRSDDKVEFEADNNNELLLESFGLEAISLKDFPKYEKVVESIQEEEVKPEKPIEEKPIEIPDEPEPVYTVVDNDDSEEKKKRGWLWILLILIPLGIASVFVLKQQGGEILNPNSEQDTTINITTIPTVEEQDSTVIDSIQEESIDSLEITLEPKVEQEEKLAPVEMEEVKTDKPMYYLVGGSFKEKANAEKYINKLKEDGFEPFYLGKRGSFFVVGIGQYETIAEASKAKEDYVAKNPGSGVWIKKD